MKSTDYNSPNKTQLPWSFFFLPGKSRKKGGKHSNLQPILEQQVVGVLFQHLQNGANDFVRLLKVIPVMNGDETYQL
jgi:hypothetical protein